MRSSKRVISSRNTDNYLFYYTIREKGDRSKLQRWKQIRAVMN